MESKSIFVTGGSGFVGRWLVQQLRDSGKAVTVAARKGSASLAPPVFQFDGLSADQGWAEGVEGHEVVIHCAARAHIMNDQDIDPLTEFRRVNVDGTLNLAKQAAAAGVKRFVFISSIGVNGNSNTHPFMVDDQPNPVEPYALSKWEAEQGLWQVHRETGMELVIIRPPLVYGPGAPGNFGSLVRWVKKGIPLPLGAIHNKRSLVGIDNLVDLIILCVNHPAAANQVFLAGDGEDMSTTELLRGMARVMGKPARLVPVPAGLLQFGATLLGKKAMAQRLLGSLQVDISHTRNTLNWTPPVSVDDGFHAAASAFLNE